MDDGIYPGVPRAEYERIEAINYSTLKLFDKSAAHARESMIHPSQPTDAMDLGTALHTAIYEPARFESEYVQAPKVDRRTTAGKKTWAEFEDSHRGKEYLSADDWDRCKHMADAIYQHDIASALLSAPGKNEVTILWTDSKTGIRCKSMLDRICLWLGWTVVVDLKSTVDASAFGFQKAVAKYLYDEQASFYLHGLHVLGGQTVKRRFLWMAAENVRPWCVAVYEPDADSLEEGGRMWRTHLDTYARCLELQQWPGYPSEVNSLRLPRWRLGGAENGFGA